jgi:hypothetical protein
VSEVEFLGEQFRIAERVGLMPMMRFAKVAKDGGDSDDLAGLTAMYDLLEQCLAEDEWERFQAHADNTRADGEELMGVVARVFEVLSARPTRRPSGSSAGPSTTARNSTVDSSSQVIAREEAAGRPDRALILVQAQEARAAS